MSFQLPQLSYSFDALEPHIDARTMEIHYSKHHQGYTDKLNAAIEGTDLANTSIEEILSKCNEATSAVRNNAGGFYNHNLFWESMQGGGEQKPEGALLSAIEESFKSFDAFKEEFNAAAKSQFGSGWAWLVRIDGKLEVMQSPNQDNPLMGVEGTPDIKLLLGLDVWEHAYYLNYQNRRPDYVEAWWQVVDWKKVAERFAKV